jgi:acetate kinase
MRDSIFVVNADSSSIKFQLFSVGDDDRLERRMKGQMDGIGSRPASLPGVTTASHSSTGRGERKR